MDGYISVGFVLRNDKLSIKENALKQLLKSMRLYDYSVVIYRTSLDKEGETWKEEKLMYRNLTDHDYQRITEQTYTNLLLLCSFLGIKNQMINITFYREKDYFGFILDLFQDPFRKNIDFHQLEMDLVEYVKTIYQIIPFDYAVCQHDGINELSPDDIEDMEEDYCFMVLSDHNDLTMKKGNMFLDGKERTIE